MQQSIHEVDDTANDEWSNHLVLKNNECTRLTSVLQAASHVKSTGSYLRLDVFLKDTGDRGKLDINILV